MKTLVTINSLHSAMQKENYLGSEMMHLMLVTKKKMQHIY